MQLQIALWIFIMGINFSLNQDSKKDCYQAEKGNTEIENHGKIRGKRSLPRHGQALKHKQNGVCSTWGNFHFRTFDGNIYRFPGICNYLFASHCGKHYEDFNIQIDQSWEKSLPTVSQLSIKINEQLIEVIDHKPSINGENLDLPYSNNDIWIDNINSVLHITVKLKLEITWEDSNIIHLTLNKKYMGETCGLCGNYNGNSTDDLVYGGHLLDPLTFGKLYKLRKPGQTCQDPKPETLKQCNVYRATCLKHLRNYKWLKCNALVKVEPYVEAYMLDMCLCNATLNYRAFCLCSTLTEYSRQCALAGGTPPDWRSISMCYKPCPANLVYKECSPPCTATCSNPGVQYFCDGPCVAGCTCKNGLVFDDITGLGCIPIEDCSCTYDKEIYPPGSVHNSTCSTCLCSGGHWNCKEIPCPSTCAVEGGSHITTFDKAEYIFNGKCVYVLAKPCANSTFAVNIEMKKCAYSASATCLTKVFLYLDGGLYEVEIAYDNYDFPQVHFDKKIMAKAGVTIFWPSSFYIIVYTNKGLYLEVQLTPIMQLYVVLEPSYKEKMCGLCGNFNGIQKDDFQTSRGEIESNAVDFANTWKANFKCKNRQPTYDHPCIYGMEVEKYATYWCNVLLDPDGPFAACHASVSPSSYQQNCLFDTCACKRAEDCLCATLSAYVWACAAAGIQLPGWRENICRNFIYFCPPSFVYSYVVTTCIPTCRSLSEPDPACQSKFHTVDGCVCPNGTYLDDRGVCVDREDCPCYYKGIPVFSNEPLYVGRLICNCTNGTLQCTDRGKQVCPYPMVYFDCDEAGETGKGTECSKSCSTLTTNCYSSPCVSGCLCPKGLVLNGNGTCIKPEECPCVHSGNNYNPEEVATIHCNQCVCRNGTWVCDSKAEKGVCTLYGEGHYITFDNKYYTTNGNCEYTLVQDYCDIEHLWNGTFKVISENIPCGTTGTSCSKAITLYLGAHKVILANEVFEVLQTSNDVNIPYKIRSMGLFIIIETNIGLVLMWDRKSSIYIYLSPYFKGKVCGLCGNFDGNANNDFTTRSQCVVENVKQFRDSWKVSHLCPEVYISKDPCAVNPYRLAWAQKLCNIIFSDVFAPCHSEVAPEKFHENCIKDTCACDLGGDCECYCTAVAAYAQACSEACVCINWRSPTVCPVFCDFYNDEDQCDWHYKPCGGHCMKTCRNPKGLCMSNLKGLEGCYPKCTADKPFFDEDDMKCVSQCGCMDQEDNYYMVGETVESCNVCEICNCTTQGIECHYDIDGTDCNCEYEGQLMQIDEIIQVDNGFGGCKQVYCGIDGTVEFPCYTTIETTTGSLESSTTQMSTESTPSTTLSTPSTTLSTPSTTLTTPSTTLTTPSTTLTTPSTTLSTQSTTLATQSTTLSTPSTTLTTPSTTLSTPSTTLTTLSTTLATQSTTLTTPSTTLTTLSITLSTPSTTLSTPSTTLSTPSTTLSTPSTTLTTPSTTLTTPSTTLASPSTILTTPSTTLSTQSTTLTTPSTTLTTPSTTLTTQSLTLPPPITLTTPSTALIIPSTTHPASSGFSRQTENDVIIQSTEKFNISLPVFKTTQKQVVVRPVHYHNCNFTCTENGTIDESGLDCPDLENITCKGGNPPWKIYDQEGCCFYYDCPHCIGPLGVLKNPGDTWIDECSSCKCETYFEKQFITSKISCQPVRCPPIDFNACDEGTQKLFITFTNVNRCCPKLECQCDPSKCTYEELPCPLGFEAIAEAVEGECCAILYCRPMNVCIADGAIYQIGQEISVNKSLCKTCICSRVKNATTGFNTISCKSILCMKHCPQGFIYKKSTEDCCGKCVQVACVITAPDGSTLLLKANQSKFLPNDSCTQYTCECIGENFITSSQKKVCPARTEEDCTSDLLQTTPDGCCTVCTAPKKCMLQKVTTQISQKGCSAKVTLAYCEGWCLSYRRFSETSLQMAGKCECCMETKLAKLQVTLLCPWGKSILIDVYSPTSCACSPVTCV